MKINENMNFTDEELKKLERVLTLEEKYLMIPYKNISGGFARAEVYDADEDVIDVEVIYGVQSDAENVVHSENLKLSRRTFVWHD